MRSLFFLLFFVSISFAASAQTSPVEWYEDIGEDSQDYTSITELSDGNIILATSINFNTSTPLPGYQGATDIVLKKISPQGVILWQDCFGSSDHDYCRHVETTSDGGFLVCGGFSGSDGDFLNLNNDSTHDIWFAKYDSACTREWIEVVESDQILRPIDFVQDSLGNIYLLATGSHPLAVNFHGESDALIIKLNSLAQFQWAKYYGGSALDLPYDIEYLPNGRLAIVGRSESSDGDLTTNNGNSDAWLLIINDAGTVLESYSVGGDAYDEFYSINVFDGNNLIINGTTLSNNGSITNLKGISDILLMKTNVDGQQIWVKTIGASNQKFESYASDQTIENDVVIPYLNTSNSVFGLYRINSNADIVFNLEYAYSTVYELFYSAMVDYDNELYVVGEADAGNSAFPISFDGSFLVKFVNVNDIE